jgi:hypothetical protein
MRHHFFVAAFFLSLALTTPAHALFRTGLLLGAQSTAIHNKSLDSQPDGLGYGAGLITELSWGSWALEFDAIYAVRKVQATVVSGGVSYTAKTTIKSYHFPLIARFWLADIFSMGLGPYYTKYVRATGALKFGNSTLRYDSPLVGQSDIGIVFSAALAVPLGPLFSMIVDGRYNHGFKQNALREVQGFIGPQVRF